MSYLVLVPFYLPLPQRMLRQMVNKLADSALMLRYKAGDSDAFETLYNRHRLPLYRFLARQLSEQQSCEDLFQEVWSKVIQARQNYRADAKFTTYLYRIARNCLIDHYRRVGRQPEILSESDSATPEVVAATGDPLRKAEQADDRAAILVALTSIPYEQREVFLLREEAGFSLAEIATITGVGHETVKSRLRYALMKLRDGMNSTAESNAEAGKSDYER